VRGDITYTAALLADTGGSPPRGGDIPGPRRRPPHGHRAHPRVRGDIYVLGAEATWPAGSPPRARGHPSSLPTRSPTGGLTPACAGTSRGSCPMTAGSRAHPRVRGDILRSSPVILPAAGSPPRARGHPQELHQGRALRGLTPACAGTSVGADPVGTPAGAHPRVRGDITRLRDDKPQSVGSPPRARGHRKSPCSHDPRTGLTPACAGTSDVAGRFCVWCWAHPRVRGDILLVASRS